MNIITNADVKTFLTLLKAGLKNGRRKALKNYSMGTPYDGTDIIKEYYVNLEFSFFIDGDVIDQVFAEDDFESSSQIEDMLKDL